MEQHTSWWPSRYGPTDERGSLNEITPATLVAAAGLVGAGRVYDLGRVLHADVPRFPGGSWQQTLVSWSSSRPVGTSPSRSDRMQRDPERERLHTDGRAWKLWGPYLAERAWGTVREDYSPNGNAWEDLPHDHARSRAYRWSEDGLAGICDAEQRLCFALALWNGNDPILKERLFGLTGNEGNHGEDVKEAYFYLDSTPTHSWMQMRYKYPQAAFPYAELVAENRRRGRGAPEYELLDTGAFDASRYFDVTVSYAKAGPEDILVRLEAANRGPEPAELHLLPTLWFRNSWSWGNVERRTQNVERPRLRALDDSTILAEHPTLGSYALHSEPEAQPQLLFTENESNAERLWGQPNSSLYVKDAFHRFVVNGEAAAVNPAREGTKAAIWYQKTLAPGEVWTISMRLRLIDREAELVGSANGHRASGPLQAPFSLLNATIAQRAAEADQFYAPLQPATLSADERLVQRQAFAGMLWSKQFYHYDVARWLDGDPGQVAPPAGRKGGRNSEWRHLNVAEIISMCDTWEYPWFAAWDLAFHCIPLALLDPQFAKEQLLLLGREWMQHPNGQIPAYEWAFGDVNPPVLAWAAWRVYKIEQKHSATADRLFLERIFHKLLLNFTWWVNRKDAEGNNVFQGGFLGMDNVGVFDRSAPLPTGGHIEQSDGTAWMGMFCLNMLTIALELAKENSAYEDIATKFFEHFLSIAAALNNLGGDGVALWDDQDEFFYDVLHLPDGGHVPLKVRSMVGLIPLFGVTTIEPDVLERLPAFRARLEWYLEYRPDLAGLVSRWQEPGMGERRLLALVRGHRMKRVLRRMLDPEEFLSDYGVRSVSRYHLAHPYSFDVMGARYSVAYRPGESDSGLFGGNSNWRGPIWFPVNYLLVEALQQFHHYYGDDFVVECPTGSGSYVSLRAVADELARRLAALFTRDEAHRRPALGPSAYIQNDPHWRDLPLFYEYFHGDTGAGVGASHQTGWTGLVAKLIHQQGEARRRAERADVTHAD